MMEETTLLSDKFAFIPCHYLWIRDFLIVHHKDDQMQAHNPDEQRFAF